MVWTGIAWRHGDFFSGPCGLEKDPFGSQRLTLRQVQGADVPLQRGPLRDLVQLGNFI